jgi:hypothetical protein
MRGWTAYLARAKSPDQEVEAYQRSRNLADFERVPGLKVEDWAK